MKRIVLFSTLTEKNMAPLLTEILPKEMENKILAYMSSNGANSPLKYRKIWQGHAKDNQSEFFCIDNSKTGIEAQKEIEKLEKANVLVITGGNTFTLLKNLRRSGLDKAVVRFTEKPEFVLSGFSAGAIVLTPTIATSNIKGYDINDVGLKDLTGLGILDFEVFAHYSKEWRKAVSEYEKTTNNEVKKLSNEDHLVIEL